MNFKHIQRRFLLTFVAMLCSVASLWAQTSTSWAEQKMATMTLEEKISQLVIMRIHSNKNEAYYKEKVAEIKKYQPGGVCFFQGGPIREIHLTNRIQAVSKIPLLVSMDAEWGPSMRLDSCTIFPRFLTLGALPETEKEWIYKMGKEMGKQCNAIGVHLNFAPVVDVNNNKNNPVINSRSFGEDKEKVYQYASTFLDGMESEGVMGCLKHFPGHGDTGVDSHYGLPVINKSKDVLDNFELYPYRKMIENREVDMVMVSHLNVPALDSVKGHIATLSYPIVTELLKNELHFKGVVITDGMEMNGLRKYFPNGADAEILSLKAGVDILLLPNKLAVIIPLIAEAVHKGILSEAEIDEKCLKVLRLKEKYQLHQPHLAIPTEGIYETLQHQNAKKIIQTIEEKAVTLVKNENIIPLKSSDSTCFMFIGDPENEGFSRQIAKDYQLPFIKISENITYSNFAAQTTKLAKYKNVIVIYLSMNQSPKRKYGITENAVLFLNHLAKTKNIILATLGNPYALEQFKTLAPYKATLVGYQRTEYSTRAVLSGIFGAQLTGTLPVSILSYPAGHSAAKTSTPSAQISPEKKAEIDGMIQKGIQDRVFPGCQMIACLDGEVIYDGCFGHTSYDQKEKVSAETMYDVASITKPLATTLAVMKLYDEGKIALKDPISKYLLYTKNSTKGNLTIDELLTHTSGLKAFIPFYYELSCDSLRYTYLNDIKTNEYSASVANNLHINPEFTNLARKQILSAPFVRGKYIYSDLNFILLKEIVEVITKQPLDEYLTEHFYNPMQLTRTAINPLDKGFCSNEIAPTENDTIFRMQTVQGYVHDQSSACMGGTAGNAGLFSTTSDLLKIVEMLENGGILYGRKYFSKATVKLFTSSYVIHNYKRRGLGFYLPKATGETQLLPSQASVKTYGHQGFTGTVFWCDPDKKLIYIFLSNRVHPNVEPNNLVKSKLRLTLQEKIYESLQ